MVEDGFEHLNRRDSGFMITRNVLGAPELERDWERLDPNTWH